MLDTKANSGHCACCMTSSGGQEWSLRCIRGLAVVSDASNMKAFMPKPQHDPSLSQLLWSCCMLTLPAVRQWWSWIKPQMWWMFWSFATTSWSTLWCTWPLIRLWKLFLCFCGKVTSRSSEPWPSSWVTEEPTLKAMLSKSFVSLWVYRRLGLHLTMLKPIGS